MGRRIVLSVANRSEINRPWMNEVEGRGQQASEPGRVHRSNRVGVQTISDETKTPLGHGKRRTRWSGRSARTVRERSARRLEMCRFGRTRAIRANRYPIGESGILFRHGGGANPRVPLYRTVPDFRVMRSMSIQFSRVTLPIELRVSVSSAAIMKRYCCLTNRLTAIGRRDGRQAAAAEFRILVLSIHQFVHWSVACREMREVCWTAYGHYMGSSAKTGFRVVI